MRRLRSRRRIKRSGRRRVHDRKPGRILRRSVRVLLVRRFRAHRLRNGRWSDRFCGPLRRSILKRGHLNHALRVRRIRRGTSGTDRVRLFPVHLLRDVLPIRLVRRRVAGIFVQVRVRQKIASTRRARNGRLCAMGIVRRGLDSNLHSNPPGRSARSIAVTRVRALARQEVAVREVVRRVRRNGRSESAPRDG